MNKETGKQVWIAPKLEQIAMVNTAGKGNAPNESQDTTSPQFMEMSAQGGQS
jgi:hypothetical protein